MSTDIAPPSVSIRKTQVEEHGRDVADKILDIYNASRKGDLGLIEARKKLVEIDPVLIRRDDWLTQRAYVGAKDIGGYPVAGKNIKELKARLSYVGGPQSLALFRELVRVGANVRGEKKAFQTVSDIAPQFLDVPGITFPPPHPFSNPRVRALFEHNKSETSHNLDLRRDGLYFVEDEEPIVKVLKDHITGDITKEEAEEKLRDIHPGLLEDYNPPTFS